VLHGASVLTAAFFTAVAGNAIMAAPERPSSLRPERDERIDALALRGIAATAEARFNSHYLTGGHPKAR
jgi:hypothetical protein